MSSEGEFWKDPPGYFEQLVYPAYVDAHRAMFIVRICPSPLPLSICVLTQGPGRRRGEGSTVTPKPCAR